MPNVVDGRNPQIERFEAEHSPYADGKPYRERLAVVTGVLGRPSAEWEDVETAIEALPGAGDMFATLGRHAPTCGEAGTAIDVPFVYRWPLQNARVVGSQGYAETSQVAAATARD